MNDHFPVEGSEVYLPRPYPFQRFLRVAKHRPNEHDFHNESHPFSRFESRTGLLDVLFSANNTVEQLWARIYEFRGDEKQGEIDKTRQTARFVSEQAERKRWLLRVAFPSAGLYQVSLYFNTWSQTEFFVDSRKPSDGIPFLSYSATESNGFVPISPIAGLTTEVRDFAIIRFFIATQRSRLLFHLITPGNEMIAGSSNRHVEFTRLIVPDNPNVYEDVVVVSFTEKGRWQVEIYLEESENSYTQFVTYQFDVEREIDGHVSPVECIPPDRQLVPLVVPPNVTLSLVDPAIVIDTLVWEITITVTTTLVVNLRKVGDEETIFPNELSKTEEDGQTVVKYEVSAPTPGHYRLLMWIGEGDETEMIEQSYAVALPPWVVSWVEKPGEEGIVPDVPQGPYTRPEPPPPPPPPEKKSKCCLLL
jgi:hypothetical protein